MSVDDIMTASKKIPTPLLVPALAADPSAPGPSATLPDVITIDDDDDDDYDDDEDDVVEVDENRNDDERNHNILPQLEMEAMLKAEVEAGLQDEAVVLPREESEVKQAEVVTPQDDDVDVDVQIVGDVRGQPEEVRGQPEEAAASEADVVQTQPQAQSPEELSEQAAQPAPEVTHQAAQGAGDSSSSSSLGGATEAAAREEPQSPLPQPIPRRRSRHDSPVVR